MITTKNCNFEFVNGLQGDPAVWVFFPRSGESILFDAGNLANLSNKDLLRVRKIFVSHTHIDHFIGFDQLLRVNIPHFRSIDVIGPAGITANVQGKLQGYLWNLVDTDQVRFRVIEVSTKEIITTELTSTDKFKGKSSSASHSDDPIQVSTLDDGTTVFASIFDHGTPTIGYCCKAPKRYHVNEKVMDELQLNPGPWIKELQTMTANRKLQKTIQIDGKTWDTQELVDKLFAETEPHFLGYVTDLVFSESNLAKAKRLFSGVDILISESNFASEHRDRAFAKKHLTTKQAAMIARHAGAKGLNVFHISNIYGPEFSNVRKEAEDFFTHFSEMPDELFAVELKKELKK